VDGPGGGSSRLLDDRLARPVRSESAAAVAYWWRVSPGVVWRWRKALGVTCTSNEGSRRLVHAAARAGGAAMRERGLTRKERAERRRRALWLNLGRFLRTGYQQHFLDLCELLGQPKPAEVDPKGTWYTFEKGEDTIGGGKGWADVWLHCTFGWEYKGKHKDLKAAYQQLLKYREALENPSLLVVCDLDRFEIHTNFPATVKKVHAFDLDGLGGPQTALRRTRGACAPDCRA
jgi:hypothetical protein